MGQIGGIDFTSPMLKKRIFDSQFSEESDVLIRKPRRQKVSLFFNYNDMKIKQCTAKFLDIKFNGTPINTAILNKSVNLQTR